MVMQMDMWATALPSDLLLHIFRRLGSTAVIRSAAVCRPWRGAIINHASCLWPRPDRFLPDLLVGFSHTNCRRHGRLEYEPVAGTSENVPAVDAVDVTPYHTLLASRDGFLLLGENPASSSSLCLIHPLTGGRRFFPAADFGARSSCFCKYTLVTGYDDDSLSLSDADGAGESWAVRILAVDEEENGITYRIFSSTSVGTGAWGPVKRSAKIVKEDRVAVRVLTDANKQVVVCDGSVVYWLVIVSTGDGNPRTRLFAMDMRTERTWTTELPEERDTSGYIMILLLAVATSKDGRQLSLILSQEDSCQIEVWVLDGGDSRWTLQRTMDMDRLLLPNSSSSLAKIWVRAFCPRSGCLFGICSHQDVTYDFLVGVDESTPRLIQRAHSRCCNVLQYEMCWSTYISKMKNF